MPVSSIDDASSKFSPSENCVGSGGMVFLRQLDLIIHNFDWGSEPYNGCRAKGRQGFHGQVLYVGTCDFGQPPSSKFGYRSGSLVSIGPISTQIGQSNQGHPNGAIPGASPDANGPGRWSHLNDSRLTRRTSLHKLLSRWTQIYKRQRFNLTKVSLPASDRGDTTTSMDDPPGGNVCFWSRGRGAAHLTQQTLSGAHNWAEPVRLACSGSVQSSNVNYYGWKRLVLVNNMAVCSHVATNGNGDPE